MTGAAVPPPAARKPLIAPVLEKAHAVAALHPYRCSSCHQWHLGNAAEGKPAK